MEGNELIIGLISTLVAVCSYFAVVIREKNAANYNANSLGIDALSVKKALANIEALSLMLASNSNVVSASNVYIAKATISRDEIDQAKKIAMKAIDKLVQQVDGAAHVVNDVAEEAKNIMSVTGVVADIAERTNLLALNAAIEAARAGEGGRGFAVVADQVRGLAHRTQESTKEIELIIDRLKDRVSEACDLMSNNKMEALRLLSEVEGAMDMCDSISCSSVTVAEMNKKIFETSERQYKKVDELNSIINEVDQKIGAALGNSSKAAEGFIRVYQRNESSSTQQAS